MTGPIAVSQLMPLKLPEGSIHKLSDEERAVFREQMQEMLEQRYTAPVDLANHPSQQVYATVKVNGKVVATVYNGGTMECPNAYQGKLGGLPSDGSGPELARRRAAYMAKTLGGTVVKADTAITQARHDQLPPIRFKLDEAAMKADPLYQSIFGNVTARSLVAAQEV